ncbi:hypothetical protein HELRODRAFT_99479 [Helobdella robusta]|uniref:Lipase maturation factor n=1 Tax=Helobdella robusta TaxID=6412 RepID=T1G9T0_HELRO|nr:hypothetical protein HELRODRAFT_99479 [Helobdella robusta]ESO04582.1 hypothetical protein HELRODRAFT_99479 [Helobdella robusta]
MGCCSTNVRVRNWFLVGISTVYLIAFVSLFVQIPGLYGDRGILPAHLALQKNLKTLEEITSTQPSLLHILPKLGINGVELGFNIICLFGIILSFLAFTSECCRNSLVFGTLWICYQSLFQVGQTFLWFQWDTLLLELGFLTIFVAPLKLLFIDLHAFSKQIGTISFWLVRWLTFRLMFSSGVVKLNSQCPTWWGLTAMTYHYESQCIPTPLAWYAHQFPVWFQKASTASVFIIQIVTSILFFSPFRAHRNASFYLQSFLMFVIILTGNYNFFNWVSIVMCLSLVDDRFLACWFGPNGCKTRTLLPKILNILMRISTIVVHVCVVGAVVYIAHHYFGFSLESYQTFLHRYVPVTIWVAALSLFFTILKALGRSLMMMKGLLNKLFNIMFVLMVSVFAVVTFSTSLVPYTDIDRGTQEKLPRKFIDLYQSTNKIHTINAYGLFRSMTGVGGRLEVIVEGSNDLKDDGWKEYSFLFKPGYLDRMLPVVAPHQPRLDWQMWFAALGSFQYNPWFYHTMYRLLNNQKEVLDLIDHNPFASEPPKYIRAQLYKYHYTSWNASTKNWWYREHVREYMPAMSLATEQLITYVKQQGLDKSDSNSHGNSICVHLFKCLHAITPPRYGFHVCLAFLLAGILSLLWDRSKAGRDIDQSLTSLNKKPKKS